MGFILIVVGLLGLSLSFMGANFGHDLTDSLAASLDAALETTADTLDTVEETLSQSRRTVDGVNSTVGQVQTTTANLALAIDDAQPMMEELALLVGEAIPDTISDVQDTIPNIAQTAKVVDDTLRLLSRLQIEETVPIINYDISIGLGVDYDPAIPFDEAVEEVGQGLEPIAKASGRLESEIETTGANMGLLSEDLKDLADRLGELNTELGDFRPLLDEYSTLVADMQSDIRAGQARLQEQAAAVKVATLLAAIWLGLFQLLPIYFGLELAMGYRMVRVVEGSAIVETQRATGSSQRHIAPGVGAGGDEQAETAAGDSRQEEA